MKDETAISDYIHEINGFQNTGIWMYEDEIAYCQKKYNKCLVAAREFGGLDELAAILRAGVPEDKRIVLESQYTDGWTPLWVLMQEFQCCTHSDLCDKGYQSGDWPYPFTAEASADFAKHDASNMFIAEMCMLNAVLMAASEHC